MHTRCRINVLAVAAGFAAVAALAVSSTASAARSHGARPTLTIALGSTDPGLAGIFVAQTKGFYRKAGVNVKIVNLGTGTLDGVVAGQADLGQFGVGDALIPVVQGKKTSLVFSTVGGGGSASVAVARNSPYHSILSLAGKRVGEISTVSATAAYINAYDKYLSAHGKAPMIAVPQSSTSGETEALAAGGLDAVIGQPSYFGSAAVRSKVRMIVNTSTPAGKKLVDQVMGFSGSFTEDGLFGMTSDLQSKRTAVTRTLEALRNAYAWVSTHSPMAVAKALGAYPGFSTYGTLQEIAAAVKVDESFYAPALGEISPALWATTVKWLAYWKIPDVNLAKPDYGGYANRVDMSYLNDAMTLAAPAA